MELFTGTVTAGELFFSYSTGRTQPLAPSSKSISTMEQVKEGSSTSSDILAINDIRENGGALPESPGLGVSGANPRLVNGEAVSSVGIVSSEKQADVQRLSAAQSVLKKVLNVSEAEELLSRSQSNTSAVVEQKELEKGVVNGSGVLDATPDGQQVVSVC